MRARVKLASSDFFDILIPLQEIHLNSHNLVSEHFISSLKSHGVQVDTCVLHFHSKARLNACVRTLRFQLFSMGYMVKCVNGAMRGADNNFHASQINSVSFI